MNKKFWVIISGIFGFLGVALGAFGAHGLRNTLSPEMLDIYKTGVNYQLIHSIVILSLSLLGEKKFQVSLYFFAAGIILFSFSLYIYSITDTAIIMMITPIGGLCFLAGWISIVLKSVKNE